MKNIKGLGKNTTDLVKNIKDITPRSDRYVVLSAKCLEDTTKA